MSNPVSPWNMCDHLGVPHREIANSTWTVCTTCGRVLPAPPKRTD